MNKKDMKKMDTMCLKNLCHGMKQDAVGQIEDGSILSAIRYLEVALKAEEVLNERGIEEKVNRATGWEL